MKNIVNYKKFSTFKKYVNIFKCLNIFFGKGEALSLMALKRKWSQKRGNANEWCWCMSSKKRGHVTLSSFHDLHPFQWFILCILLCLVVYIIICTCFHNSECARLFLFPDYTHQNITRSVHECTIKTFVVCSTAVLHMPYRIKVKHL